MQELAGVILLRVVTRRECSKQYSGCSSFANGQSRVKCMLPAVCTATGESHFAGADVSIKRISGHVRDGEGTVLTFYLAALISFSQNN